jgi:hypothetical protein
MLFRLTREPIRYEGPWWAYPSIAAILTIFAVCIACFRVVGGADPLDLTLRKDGDAWRVSPETAAASARLSHVPTVEDKLEITFESPSARGEDFFLTLTGSPATTVTVNGADATPSKDGDRLEIPGSAVKADAPNTLTIEPGSGIVEVAITNALARSERPKVLVTRGGAAAAANPPSQPAMAISAAFAAVVVFALLFLAPGHALAAVAGLFLAGAIGLSIANAVGARHIFLSGGAAIALAVVPLAIISVGTLVREHPALRVYLEVLTFYLLGIPFHVATTAHATPAPIPAYIADVFDFFARVGASPAALATLATVLAAMIAAAGATAVHRAALKLFDTPAADLTLVLFAFGTSMMSTSLMELAGQGIAASGIAVALYAFARADEAAGLRFDVLAGAALGLATAARLPAALALALATFGLLLFSKPGRLLWFLAGAAPFLALLFFYQKETFGDPSMTAYGQVWNVPNLFGIPNGEAAAGLLLAPSRGLFIYSPALLLCFLGMPRFLKRADSASIGLAAFPIGLVLLVSAHGGGSGWAGGFSYGPRLLVEGLAPLALLVGAGVDHLLTTPMLRRPVWGLVAISVMLQLPQFFYPNDAWNERYRGNLEVAAWRAPELQLQVHVQQMKKAAGLR